MQKIAMVFIFLCTAFTTVYAQDTHRKKGKEVDTRNVIGYNLDMCKAEHS